MLASSNDHIRITIKLQNNHHWESPEVLQLRTYKRGHLETGRRGGDAGWAGSPTAHGTWESGGNPGYGDPSGGARGSYPTPGSPAQNLVQSGEVLTTAGCEKLEVEMLAEWDAGLPL